MRASSLEKHTFGDQRPATDDRPKLRRAELVQKAGVAFCNLHEASSLTTGNDTVERLGFTRQKQGFSAEPTLHASASVVDLK